MFIIVWVVVRFGFWNGFPSVPTFLRQQERSKDRSQRKRTAIIVWVVSQFDERL